MRHNALLRLIDLLVKVVLPMKLDSTRSAKIIDGKAIAHALIESVKDEAETLRQATGVIPGLAVVLVGNDPASEVYVKNKAIQTHRAGMRSFMHMLPETTSQDEVLSLVQRLNDDPAIHGILVQLPLPKQLNAIKITNAISPHKDVDGLGEVNAGRLSLGMPGHVPCTPLGCLMLLQKTLPVLRGRHAVIIGASNLVGKPMAQLLLREGCTVSVAHIDTQDVPALARQADILIVAVGKRELVRGDWVKAGATVIDVGITREKLPDGRTHLIGDVAFEEAVENAAHVTPVPGGVGPMTIACLLHNTLSAARALHEHD